MRRTPKIAKPGPVASASSGMDTMQHLAKALDLDTVLQCVGNITYEPNPDPRCGIQVDITYIEDPHLFYVRPTKFSQLLPTFQNYAEHVNDDSLFVGMTVLYRSKIHHEWMRGKIMNIASGDNCILYDLFSMDHGFIETRIKTKRIRKTLYASVQPLARRCFLFECYPLLGNEFTVDCINAMKSFTNGSPCDMIVQATTQEYLKVTLTNSKKDDLAFMLAFSDYTTSGFNSALYKHCIPKVESYEKTFTFRSLKVGDNLHVRIQGGASFRNFYIAESGAYKEYMNLRFALTRSCKQLGKIDGRNIRVGNAVGVPNAVFNNFFERAIIKKILSPGMVTIQLIDWGRTMEKVPVASLFKISARFMNLPGIAIYCRIEGDQGRKKLMQGYPLKITIEEVGDEYNTPFIISAIL